VIQTICALDVAAQLNPQSIAIPMRDGKHLSAHLYLPNTSEQFPVILIQTPYNKNFFKNNGMPLGIGYDIVASPYAFVVLDWRCFYGSLLACTANPDRGADGYDAVEWIAGQPWSNGKVGTWGPSALGNVQFQTTYQNPPHLVCAVPEVPSPQTRYHHYYPGGSIRTEYFETLNLLFGIIGGFDVVVQNPYYNALWQYVESITLRPDLINIPMLIIGGWYDHNTTDNFMLIDALAKSSALPVRGQHKILVGPWVHGGTGQSRLGSEMQGELSYPAAIGWNDALALEFFDQYLRDVDRGYENRKRYLYFQMGDDQWQETEIWPPSGLQIQTFYLHADQQLTGLGPLQEAEPIHFTYDPRDPSPTVGGKTLNFVLDQGPYDQRLSVESRNDNLVFSTAPLPQDLVVKGSIKVHLHVASNRPDTDFVIRLTDVYPDGRSMLLGSAIQRMRFREGYRVADTTSMQSGAVYPITLSMDPLAVTFKAGHRLRLIITSSNYPRYNRNMNNEGEMYPNDNIDTLVNPLVAQNTVYTGDSYPSRMELPVESAIITGNEEASAGNRECTVYPNPADNMVEISSLAENSKITLLDLVGAPIFSMHVSGSSANIDISSMTPGVYLLVIQPGTRKSVESHLLMVR
jgi:predicted acyl esterase